MSKLLRFYRPGQRYFITAVTHQRNPILVDHVDLLRAAVISVVQKFAFEVLAWVVLPDHLHGIIDPGRSDLSGVIRRLRLSFANSYLHRLGVRRGRVWQPRFWDHIIRDQEDMNRHIDYIHYNPVKHGLVRDPSVWRHSSLNRYMEEGLYEREWGILYGVDCQGDFGE